MGEEFSSSPRLGLYIAATWTAAKEGMTSRQKVQESLNRYPGWRGCVADDLRLKQDLAGQDP